MSTATEVRHREILENAVYSPCEVSYLLKIGMDRTYKLLRSGKLKTLKLGEGQIRPPIRVTGKELLKWIHKTT
jgi:hypothetical protein